MRKAVRTMLLGLGIRTVYEADDGAPPRARSGRSDPRLGNAGLGASFVRIVRTPESFRCRTFR
jgi:hypothetical protein